MYAVWHNKIYGWFVNHRICIKKVILDNITDLESKDYLAYPSFFKLYYTFV